MIITTMPYAVTHSTENDVNISYHWYNPDGTNEVTIKQGNLEDPDKMVLVTTETINKAEGKIIQIVGHLTKYLHISITGTPNLEVSAHSKRNPN